MDNELRLDGNAAAGTLGEVFSFEVTTAEYSVAPRRAPNAISAKPVSRPSLKLLALSSMGATILAAQETFSFYQYWCGL